jgi:hypothetical protein
MIWDSYKEAVPMAIAEVDPTKYLPSTIQLLNRFNGRIILELRKPQAASQGEGSVSREEFDALKSLVGQVLNELKQVQEVNKSLVE